MCKTAETYKKNKIYEDVAKQELIILTKIYNITSAFC